jgi:hypothetical protein
VSDTPPSDPPTMSRPRESRGRAGRVLGGVVGLAVCAFGVGALALPVETGRFDPGCGGAPAVLVAVGTSQPDLDDPGWCRSTAIGESIVGLVVLAIGGGLVVQQARSARRPTRRSRLLVATGALVALIGAAGLALPVDDSVRETRPCGKAPAAAAALGATGAEGRDHAWCLEEARSDAQSGMVLLAGGVALLVWQLRRPRQAGSSCPKAGAAGPPEGLDR